VAIFQDSNCVAWRAVRFRQTAFRNGIGGDQYEDDLQTDKLPAATTVDLFGKLPIARGFSAVVRAENVFDVDVVTRNQAGSIDLGTPRTLWIGVRFGG